MNYRKKRRQMITNVFISTADCGATPILTAFPWSFQAQISTELTMQKAPVLFYSGAFSRLEKAHFIALR